MGATVCANVKASASIVGRIHSALLHVLFRFQLNANPKALPPGGKSYPPGASTPYRSPIQRIRESLN
jgi:hypothetical protein